MSVININNVLVLNNPTHITEPLTFEITYESSEDLKEDTEWKVTYVGKADDTSRDQVLDSSLIGPVTKGASKFTYVVPPPDTSKIDAEDLLSVTVILLQVLYKGREFIRIGYYVNNEYDTPELRETPPEVPLISHITRNILHTEPRVTRWNIEWDAPVAMEYPPEEEILDEGDEDEVDDDDDEEEDEVDSADDEAAGEVGLTAAEAMQEEQEEAEDESTFAAPADDDEI